ncbi:hypothetical protein [Massilia niastensis]|uniref:hypothetical protein n=1 Tax=Massilia niastensis TaxID=544911 RepID=UPI000360BEA2|nr:hypothetical protein [Massilia niastensis]
MAAPIFTFLNHACFMVRTGHALLLADPWIEGSAHDDAWRLLDESTSSAALIAELNGCGLPVFVWCSSARPDRLPTAFLRRFRSEFRGIATFLYRQGRDWALVEELRRHRLAVAECADGQPVALAGDLRITAFSGAGEAYFLLRCGRRSILCTGERALAGRAACSAAHERLVRAAPRIDLLLTGFAPMDWCGNPDQPLPRESAAARGIDRLAVQAEVFDPRLIVPIASFARFGRADNGWLNEGRRSPAAVAEAPRLDAWRGVLRFLQPGAQIDLERDSAASLASQGEQALAHWMHCWSASPAPLPRPPQAPLAELKNAFLKYRLRVGGALHGLPRLLEMLRLLRPLVLHLPDLRQIVELSYRHGLRTLARDAPAHLAMCSGTALCLLRSDQGFESTHAGGCFWVVRANGLTVFGRFFLPQRMARRGQDRRRPLAMGGVLLRALLGKLARGLR